MEATNTRLIRRICQNHLTNGGIRSSTQVSRFLAEHSDQEIARTLYEHDPLYVPGKIRSYCSQDELEPVFAELRAEFPDWMKSVRRHGG